MLKITKEGDFSFIPYFITLKNVICYLRISRCDVLFTKYGQQKIRSTTFYFTELEKMLRISVILPQTFSSTFHEHCLPISYTNMNSEYLFFSGVTNYDT
jgi:hypothetical protein